MTMKDTPEKSRLRRASGSHWFYRLMVWTVLGGSLLSAEKRFEAGGELQLKAGDQMRLIEGGINRFSVLGTRPSFDPISLPDLVSGKTAAAILSFSKDNLLPDERLEVTFSVRGSGGKLREVPLSLRIKAGMHDYLFDLRPMMAPADRLTAVRIHPGRSPGVVEIPVLRLLSEWPEDESGFVSGNALYRADFSNGVDGWINVVHDKAEGWASYVRTNPAFHHYAGRLPRVPVSADATLKYEAEVDIPGGLKANSFWLWWVEFDADGKVVEKKQVTSPKITRTEGWQKIAAVGQTGPRTARVELRMSNWGIGTVNIRSVTLRRLGPDSFDYLLVPRHAGTMEEKKILNDWSLRAVGTPPPHTSLTYENLPAGVPYAVNAVWQNLLHPRGSFRLSGTVEDGRWPRSSRRLESLSLRVHAEHLQGDLSLSASLVESGRGASWTGRAIALSECKDGWREFVFKPEDFTTGFGHVDVVLLVEGGKGRVSLRVADVRLRYADGTEALAFQEWKDPYWYYPRLPEPMRPVAADSLHRIMHGGGAFFARSEQGRRYLAGMKEVVPNLGIQSVLSLEAMLANHRWFVDQDIALGYQNATPYLWQAAVERDALSSPVTDYAELTDLYHKIDYTSEAWRDIYKEVAARFKDYGIAEYQLIDGHYITRASQSDRHVARVLREEDGGVLLADGSRIHFWDYFESYAGTRWTAADVGLADWTEYRATPKGSYTFGASGNQARRRGYLDMALRHYDYMRWHADVGGIFKDVGIQYFLMNNGDDWNSANDWIFNASSAGVSGFVEETFFYHPNCVLNAYPQGLAFRGVYARSGTHHRLIAELGKGGHGPDYWEPEVAYAITFTISASKQYQSLEIDWPDETDWDTQTNPRERYHYDRFCGFLARSYAYNDATLGRSYEQSPAMAEVVSLQPTGAMYAGPYREKLATVAETENYPVSRAKNQLFDQALVRDARVLVNDNYALPLGMAGRLLEWLDARPNRVLVLHGASAGRYVDGTNWSQSFGWQNALNAPEQFGAALGTITQSGLIFLTEKPGERLLENEAGPLLSRYTRPSGSRIYYYHRTVGASADNDREAIEHIYRQEKITALGQTEEGSVAIYPFHEADGSLVVTAFNRKQLDSYQWSHATAPMQVKAFPWVNGGDRNRFTVSVGKAGDYVLVSFLKGDSREVSLRENESLELEMDGINAEVFHIVPKTDARRLDELRWQRARFFKWLDQRVSNGARNQAEVLP